MARSSCIPLWPFDPLAPRSYLRAVWIRDEPGLNRLPNVSRAFVLFKKVPLRAMLDPSVIVGALIEL